jgi:hypothetical protein
MSEEARDSTQVVDHLRWQAGACELLGSPFYATLLRRLADDAAADGITAQLLSDVTGDLDELAVGLRLLGGVHRLVLSGRAPTLARRYPSAGGDGDADAAVTPLLAVLRDRAEAIRDALRRAPQTNEVGRSATLVGALCHLTQAVPLPIRLVELGASAGLNLRCDRYEIRSDDGRSYGPPGSPVLMAAAWRGRLPPMGRTLDLIERLGCDLHPLDPTTDEDALTLMSYVWPDQMERLARLRGALALAREVPARVERAGAADLLDRCEPHNGSWLVVWHSVMWQYLETAERRAVLERLATIGASATASAPVAHVSFEPRAGRIGSTFVVAVQTWPDVGLGSDERILGAAPPHGIPVDWRWPTSADQT